MAESVCDRCLLVVPDSPISRAHHARLCERVAAQRRLSPFARAMAEGRAPVSDITPAQRTSGYTS